MTTPVQPPTPSEVGFRGPQRPTGPRPGTPDTGTGLGILRHPDPERILPGYGSIARDLDLNLVQPSIQLNESLDARLTELQEQARADPGFQERLSGTTRFLAAETLVQSPFQSTERLAQAQELLEHSPETITLPESLQSRLESISGDIRRQQLEYADLVSRLEYTSSIIDWIPTAYQAGVFGENPTVDSFIEVLGRNEDVPLTSVDYDLMVRAFTAVQSNDVRVIPELPLTPDEVQGVLRQVGPNLDRTTYGQLTGTVSEMRQFYRSLETPELPPGMTEAEFNSFMEVAGYDQARIDEARELRAKAREFREQINLEAARRKLMKENLPNDPVAVEELLKQARWERLQSIPTLGLFYPFQAINQYISKPLSGCLLYTSPSPRDS